MSSSCRCRPRLKAARLLQGRRQSGRLRRRRARRGRAQARRAHRAAGTRSPSAPQGRPGLGAESSQRTGRGQRGARQLRQARQRSYQLVGGRRRRWRGSRKPSHPQQALQDLRTASNAIRLRLMGSVAPSVARVRIFSARHAITEDVRSASGTVWAASFRTPLNKAQRSVGGSSASQRPWRYSKKALLTKMKKISGRRGAATLTKTITTSSKTGGPDPLNAFHSFGKFR